MKLNTPEWDELSAAASAAIYKVERAGFDALTDVEHVLFCVWVAGGEVNNGGCDAVWYNSSGDYATHFPEAYERIGAPAKAEIFRQLLYHCDNLPWEPDHERRAARYESLSEAIVQQIDALSDAYYAAEEDDLDLLWQFWLQCKDRPPA